MKPKSTAPVTPANNVQSRSSKDKQPANPLFAEKLAEAIRKRGGK
jgi:hypothetical protein